MTTPETSTKQNISATDTAASDTAPSTITHSASTKVVRSTPNVPTTSPVTPTTQGPEVPIEYTLNCKGVGQWQGKEGISDWCENSCRVGLCPSDYCECKIVAVPKLDTDISDTDKITKSAPGFKDPVNDDILRDHSTSYSDSVQDNTSHDGDNTETLIFTTEMDISENKLHSSADLDPDQVWHTTATPSHESKDEDEFRTTDISRFQENLEDDGVIADNANGSTLLPNTATEQQYIASTPLLTNNNYVWEHCEGVNVWGEIKGMHEWCRDNCRRGYCPNDMCDCRAQAGKKENPRMFCRGAGIYRDRAGMTDWCNVNCPRNYCPKSHCVCDNAIDVEEMNCSAIGNFTDDPYMNEWCDINCAGGHCPQDKCYCQLTLLDDIYNITSGNTDISCRGAGMYAGARGMKVWCENNCARGYCPASHCECEQLDTVCRSVGDHSDDSSMTTWCINNCARGYCPPETCYCEKVSQGYATTKKTTNEDGICHAVGIHASTPGMDTWCVNNCARGYCPASHCQCRQKKKECKAIGAHAASPGMDAWCRENCARGNCPADMCACEKMQHPDNTKRTTPFTVTTSPLKNLDADVVLICEAVGIYTGRLSMDLWCSNNCALQYCPATHCKCVHQDGADIQYELCVSIGVHTNDPVMTVWCADNCANGYCPIDRCSCRKLNSMGEVFDIQTVTREPLTFEYVEGDKNDKIDKVQKLTTESEQYTASSPSSTNQNYVWEQCEGVNVWGEIQGMHEWCRNNCRRGYCPNDMCDCRAQAEKKENPRMFCRGAGIHRDRAGMTDWCNVNCARNYCPKSHCVCDNAIDVEEMNCTAIGNYTDDPYMNEWCDINCASGNCPQDKCYCQLTLLDDVYNITSGNTDISCRGAGMYAGARGMKVWCENNCARGYCPASHCECEQLDTVCRSVGDHSDDSSMTTWCINNCARGYCPPETCHCEKVSQGYATTKKTTNEDGICHAVGMHASTPGMDTWCVNNCARGYCPASHCQCGHKKEVCKAIGAHAASPGMDTWCRESCARGNCPVDMCFCEKMQHPDGTKRTTTSTVTTSPSKNLVADAALLCEAIGIYTGRLGMDTWCSNNCARQYCPSTHCKCVHQDGADIQYELCASIGVYTNDPVMTVWCADNCANGYCPIDRCSCGKLNDILEDFDIQTVARGSATSKDVESYQTDKIDQAHKLTIEYQQSTKDTIQNEENFMLTKIMSTEMEQMKTQKDAVTSTYNTNESLGKESGNDVANEDNSTDSSSTSDYMLEDNTTPLIIPLSYTPFTESTASSTADGANDKVSSCRGAGSYATVPGMADWCDRNCASGHCPKTYCICDGKKDEELVLSTPTHTANKMPNDKTTQVTDMPSVQPVSEGADEVVQNDPNPRVCPGGEFISDRQRNGSQTLDIYCQLTCTIYSSVCPDLCLCIQGSTEEPNVVEQPKCTAVASFDYLPNMNNFCGIFCRDGNCPSECTCE